MNRKDYKKILAQRLAHCNDSIIKQSHGSSAHTQATPNDYESKTL